jgi:preprotein translocase subunit SecF
MEELISRVKSYIGRITGGGSLVSGKRPARSVWVSFLALTVFVNCVVLAGGFFLYGKVSSGDMFSAATNNEVEIETLNEERLNETLERLATQQERFLEFRSQAPDIPTPAASQ